LILVLILYTKMLHLSADSPGSKYLIATRLGVKPTT